MPNFILIHPTVWPHYNNVTSRTGQDRQRSVSRGRTVLKTVDQKLERGPMPNVMAAQPMALSAKVP